MSTVEAQKERVKRITSNLPEVYNKYFFTKNGKEGEDENMALMSVLSLK